MTGAKSEAERAPAKINLALHVVGRRADGYHLLESLTVFTRFGDKLSVSAADEADALFVSGPFAQLVPAGDDNLVVRARQALREALGPRASGPVEIRLEKNLPAISGVGGGSADAAAALRALSRLWGGADANLPRLAAGLGADVPMCLASRPLIATGIGETLELLDDFPLLPVVLVNPGVPVPTPDVFAALMQRENPPLPPLPAARDADALIRWLGETRNDLMPPALSLEPTVGDAVAALEAQGARFARMSGSGATCFGLFADQTAADHAAAAIRRARPAWMAVATHTLA